MEIKRTTEIFVETKRRFVICQPESGEQVFCSQCAELMLGAEAAATLFGVSRRAVYQLVEADTTHFAENDVGAVMICASSLAAVLNNGDAKRVSDTGGDETQNINSMLEK
jgi:hypothetical protein